MKCKILQIEFVGEHLCSQNRFYQYQKAIVFKMNVAFDKMLKIFNGKI